MGIRKPRLHRFAHGAIGKSQRGHTGTKINVITYVDYRFPLKLLGQ